MAFNVYSGKLFLTYSDSSTGYPQMFGKTSNSTSTWSDLTGSGGGHGVYGGDPAAMTYDGVVYVMYRSAYSDDELWCIGTTDGYSFGPSYEYGQTMKFSPYLTINSSNRFYQSEFTDHPSSGHYMWLYSGDSATTNPY